MTQFSGVSPGCAYSRGFDPKWRHSTRNKSAKVSILINSESDKDTPMALNREIHCHHSFCLGGRCLNKMISGVEHIERLDPPNDKGPLTNRPDDGSVPTSGSNRIRIRKTGTSLTLSEPNRNQVPTDPIPVVMFRTGNGRFRF